MIAVVPGIVVNELAAQVVIEATIEKSRATEASRTRRSFVNQRYSAQFGHSIGNEVNSAINEYISRFFRDFQLGGLDWPPKHLPAASIAHDERGILLQA